MTAQVKQIGSNGQLSLGKEFAGAMVLIEQVEKGIWVIKTGSFVPHSERWLHKPEHLHSLEKSLDWATKHKPVDNFEELKKKLLAKRGGSVSHG